MRDDKRASCRTWAGRLLSAARSSVPRIDVPQHAVLADAVLAVAAALAALANSPGDGGPGSAGAHWAAPVLIIAAIAPLAWRRVYPLTAFWATLTAVSAIGEIGDAGIVLFLTVAFAAYSAVVHSRHRGAALISMMVAAGLIMATFANTAPPIPARATPLLIFIPIMIVGNAVHLWTRRAGDSQARLRAAQAGHEAATRRILEQERARIAAELHDVVTHNVSVMVVQAGAARQVLDSCPVDARQALLAVESGGRAALTELRHLLGLLSPENTGPGDGTAVMPPQPGLDQLPALIDRVASAGLPVGLQVSGMPRALLPGQDLTAFRVVQEALTNVIKHAGRPATQVVLAYQANELAVRVANGGRPFPAVAPVAGRDRDDGTALAAGAHRGLIGLRERVTLYGGEFSAGPRPSGGWLVRATLPADPSGPPTGTEIAARTGIPVHTEIPVRTGPA